MKSIDLVMALISVTLICVFWLLMAMFAAKDAGNLRKQAVERGYAEYVVDSDGKTTWQWKEAK